MVVVVDVVVDVEVVVEVVVEVAPVVEGCVGVGGFVPAVVGAEVAGRVDDVDDVSCSERVHAAASAPMPATNAPRSNALRPSGGTIASCGAGGSESASDTRHTLPRPVVAPGASRVGPVAQPTAGSRRNRPDRTASTNPVAGNSTDTSSAVS